MKNLKKLVIASFMLVIAFVAVVSSTYAWFTQGTDASVNEITIGVVDANKSLLISKDNESWSRVVDFDFAGAIKPTTVFADSAEGNVDGMKFRELRFDDTLNPYFADAVQLEDYYGADTTAAGYEAAHATDMAKKGYIKFDLFFQLSVNDETDWADTVVKMDISKLIAKNVLSGVEQNTENQRAVSSFRLGVVVGGELKAIFEQQETNDGRYNSGDQFDKNSAWMYRCSQSVTSILDTLNGVYNEDENTHEKSAKTSADGADYAHGAIVSKSGDADYTLTTNYNQTTIYSLTDSIKAAVDNEAVYEYSLNCGGNNAATPVSTSENGLTKVFKMTIYVWMEGWDGDNINAASSVKYHFALDFKAQ